MSETKFKLGDYARYGANGDSLWQVIGYEERTNLFEIGLLGFNSKLRIKVAEETLTFVSDEEAKEKYKWLERVKSANRN